MPHPGRADDDRGDERARTPREEWHRARWADGGAGRGSPGRWAGDDAAWGPRFHFSRWARLWLPVILSFVVQVPGAVFTWRFRQAPLVTDDDPLRFVARLGLAVLGPLALIGARRFPGPVVAVVSAAAGAYTLLVAGAFAPPYIALAFAIVSAVVRGARAWAWWSLGVVWVVTVTLGIVLGVDWQPAAVVAVTLLLVLLLGVGEGIRTRRARIDDARRRSAERRLTEVQAERVRIARELHDVLAHSLSQINVQAGVGLHLIDSQPELAASALATIKQTSKSALDEVRSVLGVLREGQDATGADGSAPLVPEPDLSRIDGLVASVVSQGLAVTLRNDIPTDDSAPPKAVQLALYRIVQESLTNVIRHANAASATVVLSATPDAYTVSVVNDGAVAPPVRSTGDPDEPRPGRGLLGMRERAELLGGHLDAGPRPGGGFAVEAVIPRRVGAEPSRPATAPPPAAGTPATAATPAAPTMTTPPRTAPATSPAGPTDAAPSPAQAGTPTTAPPTPARPTPPPTEAPEEAP